MSATPFQLAWQGGAAERRFRQIRPDVDQLPWGTLRGADLPPRLVERARLAWTQGAFNEHCTATALAALLRALLEANAPIDLIGMAGDFVADEMHHVELNARMAMELGGAPACEVDFSQQVPAVTATAPLLRACELAVRICCVGETLSAPLLAANAKAATHPLTQAVLCRLAQDEPRHALLGWLVLQWASDHFDADARQHLAAAAADEARTLWRQQADDYAHHAGQTGSVADICALGWLPAAEHEALTHAVMQHDIIARLAHYDILLPAQVYLGDVAISA